MGRAQKTPNQKRSKKVFGWQQPSLLSVLKCEALSKSRGCSQPGAVLAASFWAGPPALALLPCPTPALGGAPLSACGRPEVLADPQLMTHGWLGRGGTSEFPGWRQPARVPAPPDRRAKWNVKPGTAPCSVPLLARRFQACPE